MTQADLLSVMDSHVIKPAEQVRLSGQNARILARLEQGPATNRELAGYALKYTSRLSDIRAYLRPKKRSVEVIGEDQATGATLYGLVTWPLED